MKNNHLLKIKLHLIISLLFMSVFACQSNEKSIDSDNVNHHKKDSLDRIKRAKNTVSSQQLVEAYKTNEIEADNKLKGKWFYVKGTVEDIGKDVLGKPYIVLSGDGEFRGVQCYIKNENSVASLRKGNDVTVLGVCSGLTLNVLMHYCVVVESLQQ